MGPFEKRYVTTCVNQEKSSQEYRMVLEYFYHFRKRGGDNMAAKIFECLQKADRYHMECFYKGFPEYVVIHEKWLNSESEEEFFKKHGF